MNFLLFHTVIELLTVVISLMILVVGFNTNKVESNQFLIFLGISYGFISVFDMLHILTYKGMGVFSTTSANLSVQLWIAARYVEAFSILLWSSYIYFNRKVALEKMISFYTILSILLLGSIFYWRNFPQCYIEGIGLTAFKITSEYIISTNLIISIILLVRSHKKLDKKFFGLILYSYITTMLSEIFLTFYIDVYGISSVIGHLLKIISFYLIYKAVIETNLRKPYEILEKTNKQLEREVSERIQIQKQLKREKEILKAILESSMDGILVLDNDGRVIHGNSSFLEIGQIPQYLSKEKEGAQFSDKIRNQNIRLNDFIEGIKDIVRDTNNNIDYLYFKDGRIFERSYYPLIIDFVESGMVWNFKDITLKQKAIDELKESEDKYKSLFATIPDGVFVHSNNKIIYANENCAKLFGAGKSQDIIGRSIMDFIHPDYAETVKNRTQKILSNKKIEKSINYRIVDLKGNTKYLDATSSIYRNKSKKMILTIFRDITEKKEIDRLGREVEIKSKLLDKVKEYDRIKTQFFSNISHELKTPLNIILGGIQLLDQVQDNMDNTNFKYMNMMRQNCYRLLRLINNLIDITKLDSGFLKMEFRNGNIVSVIENITLSVAEYVKSKGINLIFDTDTEEKIMAFDAEKLERVMLNLLSNAVKFTEAKGKITVNIYDKGDNIIISVKDTGIGVPKEMLGKIFERFRQVESSHRRRAEGSGIGLSLVYSIVKLHGGTIHIESELGKGSEFIVKLPVRLTYSEDIVEDEVAVTSQTKVERIHIEFSDIYK